MNKYTSTPYILIGFICIVTLLIFLGLAGLYLTSLIIMVAWNAVMPALFGLGYLTPGMAFVLVILISAVAALIRRT